MFDDLCIRLSRVFEHVLDQVDAAPRAVQFIPEHLIGRTGGGAKAAVHAVAQNFV